MYSRGHGNGNKFVMRRRVPLGDRPTREIMPGFHMHAPFLTRADRMELLRTFSHFFQLHHSNSMYQYFSNSG